MQDHEYDVHTIIPIIFVSLTKYNETDVSNIKFHTNIGESYLYRKFYFPSNHISHISFYEYLKINNITNDDVYKLGVKLTEVFYSLELIEDEYIKNEEKNGQFTKITAKGKKIKEEYFYL